MAFNFENLRVWKRSIVFAGEISDLTKRFPKDERFILTAQLKRACDSIALNIAEGSTGQTTKEFKRFLGITLRSGIEVVSCLHLAKERQLIGVSEFQTYYDKATEIIKMIQALRKAL